MNESSIQIPIDSLRKAFDLLLAHAARGPERQITLHRDAFWSVPVSAMYDVYAERPPEPTIGMISDSLRYLQDMAEDSEKVVGCGFIWLAEVLRAVGADADF